MTRRRILAGALLFGGAMLIGAPPSSAHGPHNNGKPYPTVTIGASSESDGKVVVTVRGSCTNEQVLQYSMGHGAAESSQHYQSSYDARGSLATAGEDYRPETGSLTVSRTVSASFVVTLTDDGVVEPEEHVLILFEFLGNAASGPYVAGQEVCDGGQKSFLESAFTIVDDDRSGDATPETVVDGTAESAPSMAGARSSTPKSPADTGTSGRSEVESGAPTVTMRSGAGADASVRVDTTSSEDEELPKATGFELVGSTAGPDVRSRGPSDAPSDKAPIVLVAAGAAAAVAVAIGGSPLWRRRRQW